MHLRNLGIGAVVLVTLTGLLVGAQAQTPKSAVPDSAVPGVKLAGHRAIYDLALAKSEAGSVNQMRGRLVLEFRDVCEGYTLTQRFRTEMVDSDGDFHNAEFSITSWESRDGLKYRFNLKHDSEGEPAEEYVGRADIGSRGGSGKAIFSKPQGLEIAMPKGTIYPSEHLAMLIRDAKAGKTFLAAKVFDGSGDDGVFEVSAAIGRAQSVSDSARPLLSPLKGVQSWNVRLAYFPTKEKTEKPQYEIAFRLFANGVSDDLLMDYGDYALKGQLTAFELFPAAECQ